MIEIQARLADITTLDVDAIVYAANAALVPGGGVDGAINRAAGPELSRAMRAIGGCPTGEARITPGFALRARHVIHAVGPIWRGGSHGEEQLLSSAYRSALVLARDAGCETVAFPAISAGTYGYPGDEAARVAVAAVREFDRGGAGSVRSVVFACFSNELLSSFQRQTQAVDSADPSANAEDPPLGLSRSRPDT
jgi:O-acetyl-ADP-ribose deacetylase (regulator of RNase III)